jgi:hypothetical protein
MATSTLPSSGLNVRARTDDVFFSGMAVLVLGSVLLGFGRSYYFAGVFRALPPNPLDHIHAAVFPRGLSYLSCRHRWSPRGVPTCIAASGYLTPHRRPQ